MLKQINGKSASSKMRKWWVLVFDGWIYELEQQNYYNKPDSFIKLCRNMKYQWYLQLLTPWEVVDMLNIIELSLWRNNQVDPHTLHFDFGKSKQTVRNRTAKAQQCHIVKKINNNYYINPYIYLYSNWNKAIKKWNIMDILYKHFDSESVYSDFQKQLIEKQMKKMSQ